MSLEKLKKTSASSLSKLQEEINKINSKKESKQDDRFWQPKKDEAGNAVAVIRFLPAVEGDKLPWVEYWRHAFKNEANGKWYIENSLTTLGQTDPVSEANSELWNTGIEDNKKLASARKRKQTYVANILVVKDPKSPENEGKVFLFSFGKKVFEKIKAQMFPDKNDIDVKEAYSPFCPWTGANFKLKVKIVDKFPNYDDCSFQEQSQLFDGDEKKIEAVYQQQYSLSPFVAPSNFKSYDELKSRFDTVVGNVVSQPAVSAPVVAAVAAPATKVAYAEVTGVSTETAPADDAEESDEQYLEKLAQQQ